jgi:hypothetical protein
MLKSIYHDAAITVIDIRDADNETITPSAGVDMKGYEGVAFAVVVDGGEEVAGFSIKAQHDTTSDFSADPQDLEGSSISFSSHATNEIVRVLDIGRPRERYVRPVVVVPNMASATPVAILAIRYNPREFPTSVHTGEFHQSPDEGTA